MNVLDFTVMNDFLATGICYLLGILILGLGMFIFSFVTEYHDFQQIKNGNVAVGLASSGLILGLANIMRFAILSNISALGVVIWGGIGIIGMLLGWFAFDRVIPQFDVDEELIKDNRAVGVMAFSVFMAISYIVGASIT